jgi:MFS family permease
MIMAASPVGFVIGGLAVGRLVREPARRRLVKPFAVLTPLALALTMFAPNAPTVAVLAAISGVALGGLMPTLNGEFVLALPHGYRARAYGVMQSGLQFTQFFAVVVTGALAQVSSIPLVVGLWSAGGLVLMVALVAGWPQHHDQGDPPIGAPVYGPAEATHVTPGQVLPSTAGKLDR